MKTLKIILIFIMAALVVTPLYGQSNSDNFNVSENVDIKGANKDLLYERAKVIFEDKYNHSPNHLKMNKNVGSLAGGGAQLEPIIKSGSQQLNYKIIMVLNDNGYSLEVTDFYYDQSRKSGKKTKQFVHDNYSNSNSSTKKNQKLKNRAEIIAKQICDDVRREMNQMADHPIVEAQGN